MVGVIIILILLISLGRVLKNTIFPPKPLPATVAFGKLPKPDLTEGIKPSAGITYKIETISGQLPTLPNTAKVFAIVANESSFGALEKTKTIVSKLGFTQEPQQISGNIYKFQDPKGGGTITCISTVAEEHPFASVTVTVIGLSVTVAVIVGVAAPVDQLYVV